MIRTQISFEKEQYARLQAHAAEAGVSMAALVREAVADKIGNDDDERDRIKRRALSVVGIGHGGADERIGEEHDRYLDEAYGDW